MPGNDREYRSESAPRTEAPGLRRQSESDDAAARANRLQRLGLSSVPVHLGEPHRQAHSFFNRAVWGTSRVMP